MVVDEQDKRLVEVYDLNRRLESAKERLLRDKQIHPENKEKILRECLEKQPVAADGTRYAYLVVDANDEYVGFLDAYPDYELREVFDKCFENFHQENPPRGTPGEAWARYLQRGKLKDENRPRLEHGTAGY
ncbi:MAG: hypothetical protein ACUVTM_05070 [Candidatus Bathyarchaeia archaeon]